MGIFKNHLSHSRPRKIPNISKLHTSSIQTIRVKRLGKLVKRGRQYLQDLKDKVKHTQKRKKFEDSVSVVTYSVLSKGYSYLRGNTFKYKTL